jgi:uncharacterized membrane protein YdjX (TVP38/TMEM64 family)
MAKHKDYHLVTEVAVIVIVALAIATALLIVTYWHPLLRLFHSPHHIRLFIAHTGPWAPVAFIGLQTLQVIVAPIPGQVINFVGGYLFGAWLGTLYATIGALIGSVIVFVLARKLGRPFVERFIDEATMQKFDYVTHKHGAIILFLIFLLPFFPDDLICYLAGLTAMRLRTFVIITTIGRLPVTFALNLAASGLAEDKIQQAVSVVAIMVVLAAVAYWQRRRIDAFVRQLSQ